MKEKYRLILGGIWMIVLVLAAVFINEYFVNKYDNQLITLVLGFGLLAGILISSWCAWAEDYYKRSKLGDKGSEKE